MSDLGGNGSVMAAHWGSVTHRLRTLHVPDTWHWTERVAAFATHRKVLLFALNFLLIVSSLTICVFLREPVYGVFFGLLGATFINHRWLSRLNL